jgi:hypothetical protein
MKFLNAKSNLSKNIKNYAKSKATQAQFGKEFKKITSRFDSDQGRDLWKMRQRQETSLRLSCMWLLQRERNEGREESSGQENSQASEGEKEERSKIGSKKVTNYQII